MFVKKSASTPNNNRASISLMWPFYEVVNILFCVVFCIQLMTFHQSLVHVLCSHHWTN